MPHAAGLRAAVTVLMFPAFLLAAGCSSHAGTPVAAASHQTAATATAAIATGRTLTAAQLESAGLTASELPEGFSFTPYPDGHWSAATPASAMPTAKLGCQPLVDLIFGTSKASAEVAVGYQGSDAVDEGDIRIATYTPSEAIAFFASVKQAVEHCSDLAYTSFVGPNDATFRLLPNPEPGDDSLSFGMVRQGGNGPIMDRFDYVRTGVCTTLVMLNGFNVTSPPLSHDLLTTQVTKLRKAQA